MKVLALDLSTKSSGYAIGEDGVLESFGTIAASSTDVKKRIIKIRSQLVELIKDKNINAVVMEEVRPQLNSHTSKVLNWLQAVIVIAIYQINPKIICEFIYPSSWRAKIKIQQGRGIKRQILKQKDIDYVKEKHNIVVKNDDQADAICIFDAYFIDDKNEINWE